VPHVQHAATRFANDREGLREQIVEWRAVGKALTELVRLAAQPFVS
jgi:hypothetical protein